MGGGVGLVVLLSQVGCSVDDPECSSWEKRPKSIYVKVFWIDQTEVTQRAYETVMRGNPSLYRGEAGLLIALGGRTR